MTTMIQNLKGKRFNISVADGYAVYEVIRAGPKRCQVRWVEDEKVNPDEYIASTIGKEGSMDTQIVSVKVTQYLNNSVNDSDDWIDSLEVGSIVHYHNGFRNWVRCEVVIDLNDRKCFKPIALVGDWKEYNLRWSSYHVKNVKKGQLWRPHASNVWEYNRLGERYPDPTKMKPLTLPEKPTNLNATLYITSGEIKIGFKTTYNIETGITETNKNIRNILNLLTIDGYSAIVKTEDNEEHKLTRI